LVDVDDMLKSYERKHYSFAEITAEVVGQYNLQIAYEVIFMNTSGLPHMHISYYKSLVDADDAPDHRDPGQLPSHVSCLSFLLAFLIGARPSVHPLCPACLPAVVAV
jgi:hypothetical protein